MLLDFDLRAALLLRHRARGEPLRWRLKPSGSTLSEKARQVFERASVAACKVGLRLLREPRRPEMAAAKIEIRSLDEKLNAFKIEVARTYVTADVIHPLEQRMDEMVASVQEEMKDTRETMLAAFTGHRSR